MKYSVRVGIVLFFFNRKKLKNDCNTNASNSLCVGGKIIIQKTYLFCFLKDTGSWKKQTSYLIMLVSMRT